MPTLTGLHTDLPGAQRPLPATVAFVCQCLIAAGAIIVWVTVSLWGASLIGSLIVATVFFGAPVLISVLSLVFLWIRKPAGYWLSMMCDVGGVVFFLLSGISLPPALEALVLMLFAVAICCLLQPSTRSWYRRLNETEEGKQP